MKAQVDTSAIRQAMKGESGPKTQVKGAVNVPEQGGGASAAPVVLVLLFGGAAAAFFAG